MSGNTMRYIIGLSFAALAVWVLQATGVLMAIAVFLMVGAVPGTSISVPPTYMLILLLVLTLCAGYWTIRQRPIRQIKELKQDYEKATTYAAKAALQPETPTPTSTVREAMYAKGFEVGFQTSHFASYQTRRRLTAGIARTIAKASLILVRFVRSFYIISMVITITTSVVMRALAALIKPHLKRAAAWLKMQAGYSLKGTASAHAVRRTYKKLKSFLPKQATK